MAEQGDYCSFSKAVEHLGDRWSLVIVRELYRHGTRGFNGLADGMPGVSRSVLADRLRRLEQLGLIERDRAARRGVPGYRLTPAGQDLSPVLRGLWQWSQRWIPEDPANAERDPDIIVTWLADRIDVAALPEERVVVQLDISGTRQKRFWLVLERGDRPSACLEDPLLADDRYVFVEADAAALFPIARGLRGWRPGVAAGSVTLFGEPTLVRSLPDWFIPPVGASAGNTSAAARRREVVQTTPS